MGTSLEDLLMAHPAIIKDTGIEGRSAWREMSLLKNHWPKSF